MISDFAYLKPGSMKEALRMLKEHEEECKVICGGQSLLVIMRQGLVSPEYVISIKQLKDANYLKYDAKSGLKIGATCTHRTLEHSSMAQEGVSGPRGDGRKARIHPGPELGNRRR